MFDNYRNCDVLENQEMKTEEHVSGLMTLLCHKLPHDANVAVCGISTNTRIIEFPTYKLQVSLDYTDGTVDISLPSGTFVIKTEDDVQRFIDQLEDTSHSLLPPELSPLPDSYLVKDLTIRQLRQLLQESRG